MRQRWSLTLPLGLLVLGLALAPTASAGSARPGAPTGPGAHHVIRGALPADPSTYAHYKALAAIRFAPGGGSSPLAPAGPTAGPTAGPAWEGVKEGDVAPPDTTGAIGPNSYLEPINLQVGLYNRTGGTIAATDLGTFMGQSQLDLSDPQALWDPATQRFYYLAVNVANNHIQWGFSKSADPRAIPGDFCNYTADFGYGGALPDYPKLGQTKNFLLIGVNVFPSGYSASDVDWITKPTQKAPFTTCPPSTNFRLGKQTSLKNADGSLAFTPVPAVQTDSSGNGWIVATKNVGDGSTGTFLTVFKVTRNRDGSANIQPQGRAISVPGYSLPPNIPQPSAAMLDSLDGRLEHAVSGIDPSRGRSGKLAVWTAHAVGGGAGSEVRWYEIDPAAAALFQSGKVTDPSLYVWNAAISPDRRVSPSGKKFGQSMVLGFNTSSLTALPAIQMVSKVGSSSQSAMVNVQTSLAPYTGFDCAPPFGPPCRWGDYSGATPDPAADIHGPTGKVWLTNEWANTPNEAVNWSTFNWGATP